MRRLASTSLTLLLLLPACGDDDGGIATTDGTTGTTGTTAVPETGTTAVPETGTTAVTETGTGTTAATETGTGTTAETGVDTTAGTETGTTAATGDTTTGGMAALEVTMSDLMLFQDCMPIVAPDPVGAMLMLALGNPGDEEQSATVTSATLYDGGGVEVATIEVTPADFGPVAPGDSIMVAVTKVPDSLMPASGCEVLECNGSHVLELALDVGGEEVLAEATAMVDCVF